VIAGILPVLNGPDSSLVQGALLAQFSIFREFLQQKTAQTGVPVRM
jgi:hypothetical protein